MFRRRAKRPPTFKSLISEANKIKARLLEARKEYSAAYPDYSKYYLDIFVGSFNYAGFKISCNTCGCMWAQRRSDFPLIGAIIQLHCNNNSHLKKDEEECVEIMYSGLLFIATEYENLIAKLGERSFKCYHFVDNSTYFFKSNLLI